MGTLEPRKNVGALLRAYAELLRKMSDAPELWLAGAATEAATEWLQAIAQPSLAGRVKHLGYIATDRRYDLYTQASMLVLPSHLEGFGIPALEAMTAGVPVIVSNRGALPEVTGGAAQVVEPDDVGALAEAMRRYLEDPGRAAAATHQGLARAKQYSWDASAGVLLERYRQLA
jgi:alpha-1,3-rhamnosyl/mannosyltransferase